jgi:hypothetical protein
MTVRIKETLDGRVTNTNNADTAEALNSSAGSETKPVYFKDGKPLAVSGKEEIEINIKGNAGTATQLKTPIKISLEGDITGAIENVNGSEDITITTEKNHDHDESYVQLNTPIEFPNKEGSLSAGTTLSDIPIHFKNASGSSVTLSTAKYHPFLGLSTSGGYIVNFGGLKNDVGFYGYKSSSATGQAWSFTMDANSGKVTSTSTIAAPTFEGVATKANGLYSTDSTPKALTVGSTTKPIYFNNGVPVVTEDILNVGISGNADTATALKDSIKITLEGDIKGEVTGVNGSSNITITTKKNHTHDEYAALENNNYMTGENTFTQAITLGVNSKSSIGSAGGIRVNDVSSTTLYPNSISQASNYYYTASGTPDTSGWSIIHTKGQAGSGVAAWELAGNASSTSGKDLWYRDGKDTTWNSWRKILDSSNFNNYAPTLTGTGASGTWGVNVSGASSKAAKLTSPIGISLTGNVKGGVTGINAGSSVQIEANMKWAVYDDEYESETTIANYFTTGRKKNLVLGFKTPLWETSQATTVIKTDDNANFADLVPASLTDAGTDDYDAFECMHTFDVNAYVDENGNKHITAIKGDENFDDLNSDVYVCGCSYYEKVWTEDGYFYYSRVFNPTDGYEAPPLCKDKDGNVLPYFLIAKYEGSTIDGTSATELRSVKNQKPARNFISYSYGANNFKKYKTNGKYYSLMTTSEQAWIVLTMLLTGTTKNIQSRWYGCHNYSIQKNCSIGLTNTAGVIVPSNSGFILHSTISVGKLADGQTSKDRYYSWTHSLVDSATIVDIQTYDSSNVLLVLDCEPFDSDTDCYVSTMHWKSGFSDKVKGRTGCPGNSPTSGKLPVVFMGVELFVGGYETLGNAFYDIESAYTRTIYSTNDATKITSNVTTAKTNYLKGGTINGNRTSAGWSYVCDIDYDPTSGVMWQKTCGLSGSGSSTGYADGVYFDTSSSGQREILTFGNLNLGSDAGPLCAGANNGLSNANWLRLGRPSLSACISG